MAKKDVPNPVDTRPVEQTELTGTVTVRPVLRRNPRAPVFFSPVVDVRLTERDIRLLSFIVPPADAEEVIRQGDEFQLPIQSQCELIVPIDTATQLIQALTVQVETYNKRHAT